MDIQKLALTLAEKMALVKAVESVMLVNGSIPQEELKALGALMHCIDFDSNALILSRQIPLPKAVLIFKNLSNQKKTNLLRRLHDKTKDLGSETNSESAIISEAFKTLGITDPDRMVV